MQDLLNMTEVWISYHSEEVSLLALAQSGSGQGNSFVPQCTQPLQQCALRYAACRPRQLPAEHATAGRTV
eukprot:3409572-Amphidinium_carterae.1